MPQLTIVTRDGSPHIVDTPAGLSLMEAIRNAGFEELVATCGGCCSCATCHVHLEPQAFAQVPPMTELEDDLLDSSDHRDARSRLSCQVPVDALPEGATVVIAQQD